MRTVGLSLVKAFSGCCVLLSLLVACSGVGTHSQPAQTAERKVIGRENVEGRILGRFVPGDRFSKLEIGMTRPEVEKLIGLPSAVLAHSAGTGWVPFYFGSDAWSTTSHYKGEGQLVFNADSRLILIDASETAR
jgi:hypothetical protein